MTTSPPRADALDTVPVVDLTGTVEGLRIHAHQTRNAARAVLENAQQTAASMMRQASYLDSLADTLDGMS